MFVLIHDTRIAAPSGWGAVAQGFVREGDRIFTQWGGDPRWIDVGERDIGRMTTHFNAVIRRDPGAEG